MNAEYRIVFTKKADKQLSNLLHNNISLATKINRVLHQLTLDPYYPGLRTHKVKTPEYGEIFSSRVTGDIRILWNFREKNIEILIYTIGGHSGKHKVYKWLVNQFY